MGSLMDVDTVRLSSFRWRCWRRRRAKRAARSTASRELVGRRCLNRHVPLKRQQARYGPVALPVE